MKTKQLSALCRRRFCQETFPSNISSTKIQEFEGANWDHDLSKEAEDGQLWQDDWDDDDTNDDFTQQLRQQIESTASSTATATTAAPATR
jgi:DSS1/SEM1 family